MDRLSPTKLSLLCLTLVVSTVGSPINADSTVNSADRLINALCQSTGNSGTINLFDQPTSSSAGPFVEDLDYDCSQSGCGVIGGEAFICKSHSFMTSVISDFYYQAQSGFEQELPDPSNLCAGSCGSGGVAIYDTEFTTDQPYRFVFDGSTFSSEVRLDRITPFSDTLAAHAVHEDGPISFDGVVTAGRFRLRGTTNPGLGNYDFELTLLDPGNAGPPPVPDGATVPGPPMTASRNGFSVDVQWTPTACTGGAVNIYQGSFSDFGQFVAGNCALADTGTATIGMSDNYWFLVVNTDGDSVDGSWSRDADGNELTYGGVACPAIMIHQPDGVCP